MLKCKYSYITIVFVFSALKSSATKDTGRTAEQGSSDAKNKCFPSHTWYQGAQYDENYKRCNH